MKPRLTLILGGALMVGCSLQRADGPPNENIDLSHVGDAVPRFELRSASSNPESYQVRGRHYRVLKNSQGYRARGTASWYGRKFHGRPTASGEPYDMFAMTAAHKTLPIPCYARVTNLANHRSVVVKINDRGPFHDKRLIDLSYAAAVRLGLDKIGTAPVEISVVEPGDSLAQSIFLQVGAFSSKNSAERLSAKLRRQNLPHPGIRRTQRQGRTLFLVQLGPVSSKSQLETVSKRLQAFGLRAIVLADEN